ncbi:MAG: FixH family protein [Chloroflexi bacterium]|nr:FixH family protein [Chloroflexota bacterium]
MKQSLMLLLLLLAVFTVVFSPGKTPDSIFALPSVDARAPAAPAKTNRGIPDMLALVVGGIPREFVNGGEAPVAGDVIAKINVERGEERYSRRIDLYLYHQATSKPVEDANVQLTGAMRYMDHGTIRSAPLRSDGGHHVFELGFDMPGEWEVELAISLAGKQTKIQLQMDIFE